MTEQQKCGLSQDTVFEHIFLSSPVKSGVSENSASYSLSSPPKMSFSFDSTATVASVKCMCVHSVNQSRPDLCNPMDCSPPGFSVHGIFQARVLEWVASDFSMTNLDSISKSRDITLPTNVCLVKAMVFPVVMYGCESWTIKKAVHFSRSVVSDSLRPHEQQHARPPCPSPTPGVHPNPCPLCR